MRRPKPQPWERTIEESDDDYQAFLAWVETPDRGIPKNQRLATEHDWATRALAFERHQKLDQDPKGRLAYAAQLLTSVLAIESEKLIADAMQSHGKALSTGELFKLFALLADLKNAGYLDDTEELADLTQLSDEDIKQIKKVRKMLKHAG